MRTRSRRLIALVALRSLALYGASRTRLAAVEGEARHRRTTLGCKHAGLLGRSDAHLARRDSQSRCGDSMRQGQIPWARGDNPLPCPARVGSSPSQASRCPASASYAHRSSVRKRHKHLPRRRRRPPRESVPAQPRGARAPGPAHARGPRRHAEAARHHEAAARPQRSRRGRRAERGQLRSRRRPIPIRTGRTS